MPRLRSKKSGGIVTVNEALAAKLGPEWEPIEDKPRRTTRKRAEPAKSDDE